jgi:hypothetical protein
MRARPGHQRRHRPAGQLVASANAIKTFGALSNLAAAVGRRNTNERPPPPRSRRARPAGTILSAAGRRRRHSTMMTKTNKINGNATT